MNLANQNVPFCCSVKTYKAEVHDEVYGRKTRHDRLGPEMFFFVEGMACLRFLHYSGHVSFIPSSILLQFCQPILCHKSTAHCTRN